MGLRLNKKEKNILETYLAVIDVMAHKITVVKTRQAKQKALFSVWDSIKAIKELTGIVMPEIHLCYPNWSKKGRGTKS